LKASFLYQFLTKPSLAGERRETTPEKGGATSMTNKQIEHTARKIVEILQPALTRHKGRYPTAWGKKTYEGVVATVFNVIADA
jgi:hypothetical protein